ncbi:MAG: hypothetical protein ABW321_27540 [Polyangiales bacterium]
MRVNNRLFGAGLAALTLGIGCGGDEPGTAGSPTTSAGTAAPPVSGGTAGTASPPAAGRGPGSLPNVAGSGAAGTPSTAGRAAAGSASPPAAGSGPAAAGSGPAAAGSGPATAGSGPAAAGSGPSAAGSGGSSSAPVAGTSAPGGAMGAGACCKDGDCLCHGEPPAAPTNEPGPFETAMVDTSAGCIFYPMDAEPPFAAVAISDGFGGSGGCGFSQTGDWGPLYASWGIVAMIIHTTGGDQPQQRGTKLSAAIEAYKMENTKADSPLMGKLSGRYGTSGFSMGGGGTTFSAEADPTLKTNVSIMAWTPTRGELTVPSLFIFGSSDGLAGTMGMASYSNVSDSTPKMAVTVSSGHSGQPGAGGGGSGKAGLAFQKVYLEGDERWLPVLLMVDATESANIE